MDMLKYWNFPYRKIKNYYLIIHIYIIYYTYYTYYIYIYIYTYYIKASRVSEREGVIYMSVYLSISYVHTHKTMVILQSNDGNTLLLLQKQWAACLKIRNFFVSRLFS